jgi:hypothetical protein
MIPFEKYCVDSAKFYIDCRHFSEIDIPNEFTLIDSETGNILDNFKKNSLTIEYKNHKIYLAKEIKYVPSKNGERLVFNKVMFYFPAKINPEKYFFGITEEMVKEVILYIQGLGYIDFNNIDQLYKNVEVKDLDIKIDYKFSWFEKDKIVKYNKSLQDRFNGQTSEFKIFNNKKNGIGIQTYNRNNTTLAKPFLKYYSKSDEIMNEPEKLYYLMPKEIQEIVKSNFIYRYEFTIKTMDFFKHFNISNYFSDILNITQDEWKVIAKYYFNKNFNKEAKITIENVKKIEKTELHKLKPTEQIITLLIYEVLLSEKTIDYLEKIFSTSKNKLQRTRNKQLLKKCLHNITISKDKETSENEDVKFIKEYQELKEMDIILGFQ